MKKVGRQEGQNVGRKAGKKDRMKKVGRREGQNEEGRKARRTE